VAVTEWLDDVDERLAGAAAEQVPVRDGN